METVHYKTTDHSFTVLHNDKPVFQIDKYMIGCELAIADRLVSTRFNGSPTFLLELRKWLNDTIK